MRKGKKREERQPKLSAPGKAPAFLSTPTLPKTVPPGWSGDVDSAPLHLRKADSRAGHRRCPASGAAFFGPPPPAARRLQVASCTIIVMRPFELCRVTVARKRDMDCVPLTGARYPCLVTHAWRRDLDCVPATLHALPHAADRRHAGAEAAVAGRQATCLRAGLLRRVCALPNNPNMRVPSRHCPVPQNKNWVQNASRRSVRIKAGT